MSFHCKHLIEDNKMNLYFYGNLDENFDFGNLEFGEVAQIVFDFGNVELINSVGIKKWLLGIALIGETYPHLRFSYRNCPRIIIDQINGVSGFLPPNTPVESLLLPFYCENCGKSPPF